MSINIPRSVVDPFYRYRRHPLDIGRLAKNGGSTAIRNVTTIAKDLKCQVGDIEKVYKKTLGCSTRLDGEQGLVLRGTFDHHHLDNILEEFIMKRIVCATCGLPELSGRLCQACGAGGAASKAPKV